MASEAGTQTELLSSGSVPWEQRGIVTDEWLAAALARPTAAELAKIERLDLSHTPLTALPDLSRLKGLKRLCVDGTFISDLCPLAGLTNLEKLWIGSKKVRDLTPLAGLTNLRELNLLFAPVSDIEPLAGLTKLRYLNLAFTQIKDIAALKALTTFEIIDLTCTAVSDLSPLARMHGLRELRVSGSAVADLSVVTGLSQLQWLELDSTPLEDLSPVAGLQELALLSAQSVPIQTLEWISSLTELRSLFLSDTDIRDLSGIEPLVKLEYLSLDRVEVQNIAPLQAVHSLRDLSLVRTRVKDLSPLQFLPNLEEVAITGTPVQDLTPLVSIPKLKQVWVSDPPTQDISRLQARPGVTIRHAASVSSKNWLGPEILSKIRRNRRTALTRGVRINRDSFRRGFQALEDGDMADATTNFDEILGRRSHKLAFYFRGLTYYRAGNYSAALDDFTKTIRLDPGNSDGFTQRAQCRWHLYNEAAAVQVRGVPPLQADPREVEGVISDCSEAIELEPAEAVAFLLRARAYVERGELSRALADYEQAAVLERDFLPEAFAGAGEVCRRTGDAGRAVLAFNEAIRLDPSNADYMRGRARVFVLKGDNPRAVEDFRAAIRLDPANKPLWEANSSASEATVDAVDSTPPAAFFDEDRGNGSQEIRLGKPTQHRLTFVVGNSSAAPFKNFKDFSGRGQLFHSPTFEVYPVIGWPEIRIAIPEAEPDYHRISAQQALTFLRALPDIRLVRRLTVLDRIFRYDPWFQRSNPSWRLLGEVLDGAEIVLYRPAPTEDVAATVAHEWAHLLEFSSPKWRRLFNLVSDLEPFVPRAGAVYPEPPKEEWAILGELLLSTAPLLSPLTSFANPIRATIIANALRDRLASIPTRLRSTEHAFYEAVLHWDMDTVRPEALDNLRDRMAGSDVDRAVRAHLILNVLNGVAPDEWWT